MMRRSIGFAAALALFLAAVAITAVRGSSVSDVFNDNVLIPDSVPSMTVMSMADDSAAHSFATDALSADDSTVISEVLHEMYTMTSSPILVAAIILNGTSVSITQCLPGAVAIPLNVSITSNQAPTDSFRLTIVVVGAPGTSPNATGDISLLSTAGLTILPTSVYAPGGSNGSHFTDLDVTGSFTAIQAAALTLVYTPPASAVTTSNTTVFLSYLMSDQSNSGVLNGFTVTSSITITPPTNTPTILPVETQSFSQLNSSANTTITIPPILVTDLVNPNDLLSVALELESGTITILNPSGVVFSSASTASVINFVGTLAQVNSALSSLVFTPFTCGGGAACFTSFGLFVVVRDLVNYTVCPTTAVQYCQIEYNDGGLDIVETSLSSSPPTLVGHVGANDVFISFPSDPVGYVYPSNMPPASAYKIAVSTNPATVGYQEIAVVARNTSSGAVQTVHVTGLPGTGPLTYSLVVFPINAAGVGYYPTPPLVFTTVAAGAATPFFLNILGTTSSTITFSFNTSADISGVVTQVNTSDNTLVNQFLIPVSGGRIVQVVQGLDSYTTYLISVFAQNQAGLSAPASIIGTTMLEGPQIIGFVASDPTNANNVYSNGDELTITFDQPTNQPTLASARSIDQTFAFSSPIGSDYSGRWTDSTTAVITITTAAASAPVIGQLTVRVVGTGSFAILSANGVTDASSAVSLPLVGNWGTHGLQTLMTAPALQTITENSQTFVGVTCDFTSAMLADTSARYTMTVQVLVPLLSNSTLSGDSAHWSSPGLMLTTTGTAAALTSAVTSVLYSAPFAYTGAVSFQWTIADANTSAVLSELVTVMSIASVNHAPVIIAPATMTVPIQTMTNVQWSPAGSSVYVELTDVDVPFYSLTDSETLTLSASRTGTIGFSQRVAGVDYVQTETANTYQLTGPLHTLNTALQFLQVSFDLDYAAPNAPSLYFLLMTIDDNANGGQPSLTTTQSIDFTLTCAGAQTVTPTSVSSATIMSTGNGLTLALSSPMPASVLAMPVVDCSSVFDAATLSAFGGASANCLFTDVQTLTVYFAFPTSFTYTTPINVRANAFSRCAAPSPAASLVAVAGVGANAPAPPTVSIVGPSVISLCSPLTLTGVAFPGSTHSLSYAWTLPNIFTTATSPISPVAPSSNTTSFLIIDQSAFLTFSNPPPYYTFGLTVTDFTGATASTTYNVAFDNEIAPFITPITNTQLLVDHNAPLSVYAAASVPTCPAESLVPTDVRITYSWSVSPALPSSVVLPATASIQVPANVLSFFTAPYTFTLRAALTSNTGFFTEQPFVVRVNAAPLQVRIAGGDFRTVNAQSGVVVDASESYDPLADSHVSASDYVYAWSCHTLSGVTDTCFESDGSALSVSAMNSPVLTFAPSALSANVFNFSLQWFHLPTSRMQWASQLVEVVQSTVAADVSVDVARRVINSNDQLALAATVSPLYADSVVSWNVIGAGSQQRSIDLTAPATLGAATPEMTVNVDGAAGFFEVGATYEFTVTAASPSLGTSSSASTSVYINRPPVCSSFSVAPPSGVALTTTFDLSVSPLGCYDPDAAFGEVLTYQFFRIDAAGNHIAISPTTTANSIESVVFPSALSLYVGVRVFDSLGAYTELQTTVTVSPPSARTLSDYESLYQAYTAPLLTNGDVTGLINAIAVTYTIASTGSAALSATDLTTLKDELAANLTALDSPAATDPLLPLQTFATLLADTPSTSAQTTLSALQYAASITTPLSPAALAFVVAILDGASNVMTVGNGVSLNGPHRRLLSIIDSATLTSLNNEWTAVTTALALILSQFALTVDGDVIPLNGDTFVGAVGRQTTPNTITFVVNGSTAAVPPSALTSANVPIITYDVAIFSSAPHNFDYVGESGIASRVITVGLYVPQQTVITAPRTIASTAVTSLPQGQSLTVTVASDMSVASNCQNDAVASGEVCTLQCRQWNGTAFDSSIITTNYAALVNGVAECGVSQSGMIALFMTVQPSVILSTGASGYSSSTGTVQDQSAAIRASVQLNPAPVFLNVGDFKQAFINDLSQLTGQSVDRFNVESVQTVSGVATITFDIWVNTTAQQPSAQSVYDELRSLSLIDVLSTTYVRYADLSTWQEQCSDLVWRSECSSEQATTAGGSSGFLTPPVIIGISVAAACLLCCLAVLIVRRCTYQSTAKTIDTMPVPQLTGKQYIYQPETTDAAASKSKRTSLSASSVSDASNVTDDMVSDVTIIAPTQNQQPTTSFEEEMLSEPVIVENEAEAAELAKLPSVSTDKRRAAVLDDMNDREESRHSVSGSSRHFYYVDDSRADASRTSESAEVPSVSEHSVTRSSVSGGSHFRVGGPARAQREDSVSRTARQSSRISTANSGGMHFRYNEESAAEPSVSTTPSVPSLNEPPSPSRSTQFSTHSSLELPAATPSAAAERDKKQIRVVRPNQSQNQPPNA